MMPALVFVIVSLLFVIPTLGLTTGVNYVAKFDNVKTTTIPSNYMGLKYTNFQISKAQPPLYPKSPPNMIASTDLFAMQIDVIPTQSYYYATLNSLYMGCLSCAGSECQAGRFPQSCSVTVVAYIDGFPEIDTRTATLQYTPPDVPPSPNANATLSKVVPSQVVNGPLTGSTFRLFFTNGVIGSTVYFDNLNYTFGQ